MWHVKLGLSVATLPDDVEGLSVFFDQAYEQFRQLDVIDPEMLSVAGEGRATFSVYVDTDDYTEAIQRADAAVRTAIHAAGGNTGLWDVPLSRPQVSATPVPA
jgi:hypothetical protein